MLVGYVTMVVDKSLVDVGDVITVDSCIVVVVVSGSTVVGNVVGGCGIEVVVFDVNVVGRVVVEGKGWNVEVGSSVVDSGTAVPILTSVKFSDQTIQGSYNGGN